MVATAVTLLFFLAAIFCKYTLVAAPSACFLDLLFQRRMKKAAGFAGSLVLLSGMAFLGLARTTGGVATDKNPHLPDSRFPLEERPPAIRSAAPASSAM